MKKTLLSFAFSLLAVLAFAQLDVQNAKLVSKTGVRKIFNGNEIGVPPQRTSSVVRNMNGNFIGTTMYDLQSNASMSSRIVAHNDGTVSAVWTTMGDNIMSRGTGYNYFDHGDWSFESSSTSRIETELGNTQRAGWGTITTVGNAEIVASHNGTDGLIISICPEKGTNEWTFTKLKGPQLVHGSSTNTTLLWPSITSTGNIIHLIACTDNDTNFSYQGINVCLLYYRGTYDATTNEITWESPRIVGDVTSEEVPRFSGDSYAVAAKGNTVAIAVKPGMYYDAFLWKSTDAGVNFTKTVFSEAPMKGDTAFYDDGSLAVAVGDDGIVHIAAGTYYAYTRLTSDTMTWYPGYGYLYYWNETMPPITRTDQSFKDPETLSAAGYGVFEELELTCDTARWIVSGWGVNAYPEYGDGPVSMPQLVAENGNVYLVYVAILEYPFVDVVNSKYYRGVFASKSTNNGASFGDNSWLSYNKDCYYLNSWELFPFDSLVMSEFREDLYTEGECVFPAVAPHLVNGDIKMIWQVDYNAGSDIKDKETTIAEDGSYIYYFQMNADSIGIYNNTNEVCQGLWIDPTGISNKTISGIKMYPNPASESVNLTFSAEIAEKGVVSVMNLMGQTMYTQNVEITEGYNMVTIPVKQFNAGVYMVTMRTNTGISTQKLIVK